MAAPGEARLALTHPTSCLSFYDVGVLYKVQSGSTWCVNTEVPVEAQGKEACGMPPKKGTGAAPSVLLGYEQNHLSGPRKLKATSDPPLHEKKTHPFCLHVAAGSLPQPEPALPDDVWPFGGVTPCFLGAGLSGPVLEWASSACPYC